MTHRRVFAHNSYQECLVKLQSNSWVKNWAHLHIYSSDRTLLQRQFWCFDFDRYTYFVPRFKYVHLHDHKVIISTHLNRHFFSAEQKSHLCITIHQTGWIHRMGFRQYCVNRYSSVFTCLNPIERCYTGLLGMNYGNREKTPPTVSLIQRENKEQTEEYKVARMRRNDGFYSRFRVSQFRRATQRHVLPLTLCTLLPCRPCRLPW